MRKLESIEAKSAREREKAGVKIEVPKGNISLGSKGKTVDIMGAKIGISGKTYDKIVAILDSGKPDLTKNVEDGKTFGSGKNSLLSTDKTLLFIDTGETLISDEIRVSQLRHP